MRKKVRILGMKAIPIWLLVLALVATGAGAAAGTVLAGKVTGEVPVAVSQALLVDTPEWASAPTSDDNQPQQVNDHISFIALPNRYFAAAADDNTAFEAAAELATGDWARLKLPLKNASENNLVALLTLNVPEGLEVEVYADTDATNLDAQDVVRIGLNTWKFVVEAGADYNSLTDMLEIVISVDDTTPPGYYTISGTIKQIGY